MVQNKLINNKLCTKHVCPLLLTQIIMIFNEFQTFILFNSPLKMYRCWKIKWKCMLITQMQSYMWFIVF